MKIILCVVAFFYVPMFLKLIVDSHEEGQRSSGFPSSIWQYLPANFGIIECTEKCSSSDEDWNWWWSDESSYCDTSCVVAILDPKPNPNRTLHKHRSLDSETPKNFLMVTLNHSFPLNTSQQLTDNI